MSQTKHFREKPKIETGVAEQMTSISRIYAEIERVQNEMFQALDALLLNLFRKALDELESLLESGNPRTVLRAVNLIIRLFLERSNINFDSPVMKEIFGGLK